MAELGKLDQLAVRGAVVAQHVDRQPHAEHHRRVVPGSLQVSDRKLRDVLEVAEVVLAAVQGDARTADHRRDGAEHVRVAQRQVPGEVAAAADAGREDALFVDVVAASHPAQGRERGLSLAIGEAIALVRPDLARRQDQRAQALGRLPPHRKHAPASASGAVEAHDQRRRPRCVVVLRYVDVELGVLGPLADAQRDTLAMRAGFGRFEVSETLHRGHELEDVPATGELEGAGPAQNRRRQVDGLGQLQRQVGFLGPDRACDQRE